MKKIALFVLSLALMLGVCSVATAATITVGAYEYALTYLPIRTYYGYSYTQQIVSQSEINTSGSITKLRFYWYDGYNNNSNNWTIYMGHTTKTAFASTSDWTTINGASASAGTFGTFMRNSLTRISFYNLLRK